MPSPKETLFFDIETVPLDPKENPWILSVREKRYMKDSGLMSVEDHYNKNAGLYAEFSQVVCISFGFWSNGGYFFKSYTGDEYGILGAFTTLLCTVFNYLSGHNIKSFDIPFLMRRYIINKMKVPQQLNTYGKKPRELGHIIDTMEIWKGTGFSSTSLEVCSLALGLPNPKQETEGSSVAQMFYDGQIDEIREYCEGDVKATMRLYNEMYKYL